MHDHGAFAVPPGFTVDDDTFVVSASGGKTWAATLVGTTIQLIKTGSGQLVPGESVTVSRFRSSGEILPSASSVARIQSSSPCQ